VHRVAGLERDDLVPAVLGDLVAEGVRKIFSVIIFMSASENSSAFSTSMTASTGLPTRRIVGWMIPAT